LKLFVDTSSLIKYYYPEEGALQVEKMILKAKVVYICELSIVEFASALMKKSRMKELSKTDSSLIWQNFNDDLGAQNVELVNLYEDDYFKASDLIMKYGIVNNLRAIDSLQLAAALKVADADFMTSDSTLAKIAKKAGLRLL